MQRRGGGRSAGQNEARQRLERRVQPIDRRLQPRDLIGSDAKRALDAGGGGKVGTEIEQLVLDQRQLVGQNALVQVRDGQADSAIGFIDVADRRDQGRRLRHAAAIDETRRPGIPRAGVNFCKLDQGTAASGVAAGGEQDQHDDDDGDRLKENPRLHQLVRLEARFRRAGAAYLGIGVAQEIDHTAHQGNDGRDHRGGEQNDEKRVHVGDSSPFRA